MRTPEFWAHGGLLPWLLAPAASLYGMAGWARQRRTRTAEAGVPVICIGNLVAGGAGKTPTAIQVALRLREHGVAVHFLTRGYGGKARQTLRVEQGRHDHLTVGDEALLLAELAPVWVGRDRRALARAAIDAGADVLVLDDGFQDPSLAKDLSLLVVDGAYGFGNGHLIPAGPLREPIRRGMARADAIIVIGPQTARTEAFATNGKPVLRGRLAPTASAERLRGRNVIAFAGIGRPEKFFETLREIGCRTVETVAFGDHHRYREEEIMAICERAARADAVPVTTRKDFVRLPAAARPMVEVVDVVLEWADGAAVDRLLAPIMQRARAFRGGGPA